MIRALGSSYVFHCDVRHDLVHRVEQLVARLLWDRLVNVHPHAGQLLLDRRPHVAEEGPRPGVSVGRCGLSRRRLRCRLVGLVGCVMVCGGHAGSHGSHRGHGVRDGRVELVGRCCRRGHAVELLTRVHVHG